ncbi:unnamed protein product [Arabis nemorensis]|uniref:Uncharacterized protein n=1 Tax=Arabis nemorensis TaxID=586526 RepID=A0A565ASC6_9BRAS|nr:unnamed protein product [Arabis nemorensis]
MREYGMRDNDIPESSGSRRPALERFSVQHQDILTPTDRGLSHSSNFQEVEIRVEEFPITRVGNPSNRPIELSPPQRRNSIHNGEGMTLPELNSPIVPSSHSQEKRPLALRLEDRLEDAREVSFLGTSAMQIEGRAWLNKQRLTRD